MFRSFSFIAVLCICSAVDAGFPMSGPERVKTTAEIVKFAENDDIQGGLRKTAYVSTGEFRNRFRRSFVAWYNPYSGEAACHVYIYTYDEKDSVWVRQLAQKFEKTHDVSVEFGRSITIRDVDDKVIYREKTE